MPPAARAKLAPFAHPIVGTRQFPLSIPNAEFEILDAHFPFPIPNS
jgi:hypothetical protein